MQDDYWMTSKDAAKAEWTAFLVKSGVGGTPMTQAEFKSKNFHIGGLAGGKFKGGGLGRTGKFKGGGGKFAGNSLGGTGRFKGSGNSLGGTGKKITTLG